MNSPISWSSRKLSSPGASAPPLASRFLIISSPTAPKSSSGAAVVVRLNPGLALPLRPVGLLLMIVPGLLLIAGDLGASGTTDVWVVVVVVVVNGCTSTISSKLASGPVVKAKLSRLPTGLTLGRNFCVNRLFLWGGILRWTAGVPTGGGAGSCSWTGAGLLLGVSG